MMFVNNVLGKDCPHRPHRLGILRESGDGRKRGRRDAVGMMRVSMVGNGRFLHWWTGVRSFATKPASSSSTPSSAGTAVVVAIRHPDRARPVSSAVAMSKVTGRPLTLDRLTVKV